MDALGWIEDKWSSENWYERFLIGAPLKLIIEGGTAIAIVIVGRWSIALSSSLADMPSFSQSVALDVVPDLSFALIFSAIFCNFVRER